MDYWEKIEKKPEEDLTWNIPEQKQGIVNVVGGNAQSFRTPVKVAEFLSEHYPVKNINLVLPDSLKNKLPPLDNLVFLPATESGSFAGGESLLNALDAADFNLLVGDFSKNSMTAKAVEEVCRRATRPTMMTRDTVDLLADELLESTLMNENLIIFGSLAQLQKIFRAVYYPKMLLLTQSLVQVVETLHKFTLSYPVALITLHNGQILVAKNGNVKAVPLEKSGYSPLTMWSGELAAKIAALNLYNPDNFEKATVTALFT